MDPASSFKNVSIYSAVTVHVCPPILKLCNTSEEKWDGGRQTESQRALQVRSRAPAKAEIWRVVKKILHYEWKPSFRGKGISKKNGSKIVVFDIYSL